MFSIDELLHKVMEIGGSDLHLKTGQSPMIRIGNGSLALADNIPVVSAQDISDAAAKIVPKAKQKFIGTQKEIDFSYATQKGRFRVNIYFDTKGMAIAFRLIPQTIPTYKELGIPEHLLKMALKTQGLILVSGATGSGKSTTVASVMQFIAEQRQCHILTIEDPIEYTYTPHKCLITQREVHEHTQTMEEAISSAMRQDPDVIMLGEMRDLETMSAALTLAETGHLVLSTLHTMDSAQTVDRIIDVFPPYQQAQVRSQLSMVLLGVLSQSLIPSVDGKRVAAYELMVNNDAVRASIKDGKTHQLYSAMEVGTQDGMQIFDKHLADLVKQKKVSEEAGASKARDLDKFNSYLNLQ